MLVQDPESAVVSGMPRAALAAVEGALVVPLEQLGNLLGSQVTRLVSRLDPERA